MPTDNTSSAPSSSNDVTESGAPKGTIGGLIRLHTYSDGTYYKHIGKVLLALALIIGVIVFVIVGLFFPTCNGTQDHIFYGCRCKDGSALDETTGMCLCLDTGHIAATNGCAAYASNGLRYVFSDTRPAEGAEFGGWTTSAECS